MVEEYFDGKAFLFSKQHGFIKEDDGDSYIYSDGSGYYHGTDGSEGYIYSDGSGYYHGADGSDGYIYSDGSGYYHGADGSDGYIYSDGSGYYHGANGSDGQIYSDGTGYYNDSDGSYSSLGSYDAQEIDDNDLLDYDFTPSESIAENIGKIIGLGIANAVVKNMNSNGKRSIIRFVQPAEPAEPVIIDPVEIARKKAIKKEKRIKRHAWLKRNWKKSLITLLLVFVATIGILGLYEFQKMTPIGYASNELIGINYKVTIAKLKKSGFSLIHTENIKDLSVSEASDEYKVTNVKIGITDSFNNDTKLPSNFPVIITYHTVKEIKVPLSSKKVKGLDYFDVEYEFEEAGFTNISEKVQYDIITGILKKEGETESVVIGDQDHFDEGDKFKATDKVIITYHTLRKYKPKK